MNRDDSAQKFGTYDYGLSDEEERRAAALHEESIVIDMLYWGPCTHLSFTQEMEKELNTAWETTHDIIKTLRSSVYGPQLMAVKGEFPEFKACWDASGITAGNRQVEGFTSLEDFSFSFGSHIAMLDRLPWVIKALTADDIRRAKAEGKHAAWINTQLLMGVNMDFLELIEPAYNLGLRMIMLTYNYMTYIGAGCTERTDAGISNFGAAVIARMNELGIIVDTGHCGRQTTLDACKLSTKTVVASHACAQGLYMHARGKSDEELRAIADTGGVIGVVTVPFFLASSEEVGMDSWLDHIDYISNLVGWNHVGIGTDWPMPIHKSILREVFPLILSEVGFREEHNIETTAYLKGFEDYRDFPNITRGLVKRGYTDDQIKGILGGNFLRVFEDVCG